MRGLIAAAVFSLIASAAQAEVWRCPQLDGKTVYQAVPCESGIATGITTEPELVVPYQPAQQRRRYGGTAQRDKQGRIARSQEAKADFKRQHPCPANGRRFGPCPGYVIDHVQALACGGADDPSNMQWQTTAAAKAKDGWERQGCGRR